MLIIFSYACIIWNCLLYFGLVNGEIKETPTEIKKSTLDGYDPSLPPILFTDGPQVTFFSLRILRIRGLDEKRGELFVEGSLLIAWTDQRFSWESPNIQQFRARADEIWMPSFYVYNAVEPEEITSNPLAVVVQGGAYWEPRFNFRTRCSLNLRYYPFDKHTCDIVVASRSKDGDFFSSSKPSFYASFVHTFKIIQNPQWNHDPPKSFQNNLIIDSDTARKVIVYRFSIQRSMPLIPLSILTPCLTCSLLLLATFWMQAGSNLRAGLCVTSMLVSSSSIFTLGKIIPASGESTPIIVEYVSITLILSALSSIQTTVSSVLRRCEVMPPVSYTTVISKIPNVCLRLMGISPEEVITQQLDQKFLFSELEDVENRNVSEREDNNLDNIEKPKPQQSVQNLWMNYVILLDRIMFYIIALILILFIISVLITE